MAMKRVVRQTFPELQSAYQVLHNANCDLKQRHETLRAKYDCLQERYVGLLLRLDLKNASETTPAIN
jgi:hypothetical protein